MHLLQYWRRNLDEYLERNSGPVLLLSALFAIGVIFGALAVRSVEVRDKAELVSYLNGSMAQLINLPEGTGLALVKQSLIRELKWLVLLWVLGISLVGVLGVMVASLIRGFVSGFVVAFVAAELGWKGVLLAAAGHLPQTLLQVPALILAASASVALSLQVIRSWQQRRRMPRFYPALAAYSTTFAATGLAMVAAALVEGYVTPVIVRFVATLITSR